MAANKVLVVDDCPTDLANIKGIVTDAGCTVYTASSGVEAIEKAKTEMPGVIYRSIAQPLGQIASAVKEVSEGNFEARTFVDDPDELGALGFTFDAMLNDRVGTLGKAQEENEQLNNAVVQLLQGVYQLSQVVDGTKLAEQAGSRMQETEKSTSELVAMVQQIAKRSRDQAVVSSELRGRAEQILAGTQRTNDRLREQTTDTNQLVEFSQKLLAAVSVFKLPEVTDVLGTRLHGTPASAESIDAAASDASVANFPDNKAAANA